VDKLDNCKEKEKENAEKHIKEIQDIYKQEDIEMKKPETNKGKQQIQNEKVLFYKHYEVKPPRPKTFEPMFIQDKIDNLDKYMKFM